MVIVMISSTAATLIFVQIYKNAMEQSAVTSSTQISVQVLNIVENYTKDMENVMERIVEHMEQDSLEEDAFIQNMVDMRSDIVAITTYDVTPDGIFILSIGFTLSRALSGLSVVTFPLGKNTGLVNMFSSESKKKQTGMVMIVYILLCSAFMIYINTVLGLLAIISAFLVLLYYRYLSIKQFGGITGDLAGYFLQLCELIMAIIVIMGDRLWF